MKYYARLRGYTVDYLENYPGGKDTKAEAVKELFDWHVEQVRKREKELMWARDRLNRLVSSAEYQKYFGHE